MATEHRGAGGFLQYRELGPIPDALPRAQHSALASSDFHWCLVCERAFRNYRYRLVEGRARVPYAGCDGGRLFEPWEWTRVLSANPDYPPVPLEDVAYPFFGLGERAAGHD